MTVCLRGRAAGLRRLGCAGAARGRAGDQAIDSTVRVRMADALTGNALWLHRS